MERDALAEELGKFLLKMHLYSDKKRFLGKIPLFNFFINILNIYFTKIIVVNFF